MTRLGLLGEILVRADLVREADLQRASDRQEREGGSLATAIATLELADDETVAGVIARELRLEYVPDDRLSPSEEARKVLPGEFCRKHLVVPIELEGHNLKLATTDPLDLPMIQDAEFISGCRVLIAVASPRSIANAIDRLYTHDQPQPADDEIGEVEFHGSHREVDAAKLAQRTALGPVVRLVNQMLSAAVRARASDVHIEPHGTRLQVRFRVDGMLQDVSQVEESLRDAIVSRLKIIAGMDIAERRRPQDGRSRLRFDGRRIDLRISTLPTHHGEKVVVRLLDNAHGSQALDGLDLHADNLVKFKNFLNRPQGLVLVTGPTGSGKTSTLYAAVNAIKTHTNNIVTVEDPVEFHLEGVSQVQVNNRAGVTFAAGLRSILRQDPDVILVGEIRDNETATIALEAAQTGHLLLSTLHTNDACSAITRLMDLGVEPFLIASSLIGVIGQRLVRRPCPHCATTQIPSASSVDLVGQLPPEGKWVGGAGCDRCDRIGFRGRIAVHEVFVVTDEIRGLIGQRASEQSIRQAARRTGMRTMMEDGVIKAAQALTTIDEVVRVVAPETPSMPAPVGAPVQDVRPAANAPVAAPVLSRPRVLAVEDSSTVATVIKYFLELEGFEVMVAEDGRLGLDLARRERPDVVVSDIHMPGMDGMELTKALRADEATRGVPILMLTSEGSVESEEQGLALGADDYLLKPVEPRRLAARIKALLARHAAAPSAPRPA